MAVETASSKERHHKRLREQFRNCLIPLIGCVDAGRHLTGIKSLHSVQWLIDVLVAVLHEQAEPETMGALIALKRTPRSEIARSVAAYAPSYGTLREISENRSFSNRTRAAAIILAGLHTESIAHSAPLPQKNVLVELYDPTEGQWFLPAVALLLNEAIVAGQQDALATMGALLDAANTDFYGRYAINSAIDDWREIARAPVGQSGVPGLWV